MSELSDNKGRFVFVVGNDVAMRLHIGESHLSARQIACLRSNPTIVEVPFDSPVDTGWTFDGTNFNPPA